MKFIDLGITICGVSIFILKTDEAKKEKVIKNLMPTKTKIPEGFKSIFKGFI
jgi:hypothetical protein